MLERAKEFTVAGQQKIAVWPFTLDVNITAFEAIGIDRACACGDAVLEAEMTGRGQKPH
jgi:hypothetical protein